MSCRHPRRAASLPSLERSHAPLSFLFQVKADRSGVESMEKLTQFTIKRVREQNGDAFVAEELRKMEVEVEAETTAARQQPVVDAAGRR